MIKMTFLVTKQLRRISVQITPSKTTANIGRLFALRQKHKHDDYTYLPCLYIHAAVITAKCVFAFGQGYSQDHTHTQWTCVRRKVVENHCQTNEEVEGTRERESRKLSTHCVVVPI